MLLALTLLAQVVTATPAAAPAPIVATEVVQAPGETADQLFSAALAWFFATFKDSKAVLEVQDKVAGKFFGKAAEPFVPPTLYGRTPLTGPVNYTVTVEVKDGRYRYAIGPFVHSAGYGTVTDAATFDGETPSSFKGNQKNWMALQKLATGTATTLAQSLKTAMSKPAEEW